MECIPTIIEHLFSFIVPRRLFVQKFLDKLCSVVPGGEIREIGLYHLCRVFKFFLSHALLIGREVLQSFDNKASVAPTVEIPAVKTKHLAHQR